MCVNVCGGECGSFLVCGGGVTVGSGGGGGGGGGGGRGTGGCLWYLLTVRGSRLSR